MATKGTPATGQDGEAGRPRTRPRTVVAGTGLIALWWFGSVGAVLGSEFIGSGKPDSDDWTALGFLGFWTLVVGAMLRSMWRGGPTSWWFLSKLSLAFGVIILGGGLIMSPFLLLADDEPVTQLLLVLLLPLIGGGLLVAAGLLLRRDDARRWCRVQPGKTTPPA